MRENCEHLWEKVERSLDDGPSYHYYRCGDPDCGEMVYPVDQLQKLMGYSERHRFMFLEDWILALFYAMPDSGLTGRAGLRKQISVLIKEFAPNEGIQTEDIDHGRACISTCDRWIISSLDTMITDGIVDKRGRRNSNGETFRLTAVGRERAKGSFDKLTGGQKEKLVYLRKGYQIRSDVGLLSCAYSKDLR
jgi:hypothetical protein